MRKVRTSLSVLLLATALAVALVGPVAAQNAPIAEAHKALCAALDQKDFAAVWKQAHAIMAAVAAREAATLTGPELYALSVAHYYLVAESLDQALKAGNLTEEQSERATAMRDRIMGVERQLDSDLPLLPPAKAPAAAAADLTTPSPVAIIGHGQAVTLANHLVPGKTTIVDFFSEYCPPCMALGPQLAKLVQTRTELALVKVDINRPGTRGIDWQSPVARQFSLHSIPHLKVYDGNGVLVAEGEAAEQLVGGWLDGQQ